MNIHRYGRRFFEVPNIAVSALIAANVVVYSACVYFSGSFVVPSDMLLRNGAIFFTAIDRHEYWRLATYSFLHSDLLHVATNMICLALWGGHLERRVGSFNFLVIYAGALIAAAIVGVVNISSQYMMIGTSGALSGIMGGLMCLWILGKMNLPASFFVLNVGLSIAVIGFNNSNIGWHSQLAGLVAGITCCALLDVLEKANTLVFRCKFPEFVKLNGFVIVVGAAALFWNGVPIEETFRPNGWPALAVFAIESFAIIKLIDVLLSIKKGLAIVVLALSAINAALVLLAGNANAAALSVTCASYGLRAIFPENALEALCRNINLTVYVVAACVFCLTPLAYFHALFRGMTDVGFVGATLRAERKRHRGI